MCLHINKNHYNKTKTIKQQGVILFDLAARFALPNQTLPNERFSSIILALNLGNWGNNCKGKLGSLLISSKQTVHCFNIAFVTIRSTQVSVGGSGPSDLRSVVAGTWGSADRIADARPVPSRVFQLRNNTFCDFLFLFF